MPPFELAAEMARVVPAARGHHFLHREKRRLQQIARVIEREVMLNTYWRAAELLAEQASEVRRRQVDGAREGRDLERPRAVALHERQHAPDPRLPRIHAAIKLQAAYQYCLHGQACGPIRRLR